MRRISTVLLLLGLVIMPAFGAPERNAAAVYFEAKDPEGDDYGPGTYVYPRNKAFEPYEGLFDILHFKVSGKGKEVYFDTKIKTVTNPWVAPEGFIHPVIHIYIATGRAGYTKPLGKGPSVEFSPRYPWEYALLGMGWEGSAFYFRDSEGKLKKSNIPARLLSDGSTIRLIVPKDLMRTPEKNWAYYLLVGSYDGFGPGFFREIKKDPGEWVFGGGQEMEGEPRIIDLLAPATGKYTQERQLKFPPKEGKAVCLYPVPAAGNAGGHLLFWIIVALVSLAGVVIFLIKPPIIHIFWFKEKNKK